MASYELITHVTLWLPIGLYKVRAGSVFSVLWRQIYGFRILACEYVTLVCIISGFYGKYHRCLLRWRAMVMHCAL